MRQYDPNVTLVIPGFLLSLLLYTYVLFFPLYKSINSLWFHNNFTVKWMTELGTKIGESNTPPSPKSLLYGPFFLIYLGFFLIRSVLQEGDMKFLELTRKSIPSVSSTLF